MERLRVMPFVMHIIKMPPLVSTKGQGSEAPQAEHVPPATSGALQLNFILLTPISPQPWTGSLVGCALLLERAPVEGQRSFASATTSARAGCNPPGAHCRTIP